jgi:hypothetical protein
VARDLRQWRAGGFQRLGRLAVERDSRRCGDVVVDGVSSQLMTEHENASVIGHPAGAECFSQLLDEVGGAPDGDRRQVPQRELVSQQSGDSQHCDRPVRQIAQPAQNELTKRGG